MIKLFAILLGLSFAICCLALALLQSMMFVIYPQELHGTHLPGFTLFCKTLNPVLVTLAIVGLVYPTILVFKKHVQIEVVLIYSGIVILIGTLLFFSITVALILPWIKIIE
jgi:hypothetical protein